jgi:hypothetical protein
MRELGTDEAVQADVLFGGLQAEAAVDLRRDANQIIAAAAARAVGIRRQQTHSA